MSRRDCLLGGTREQICSCCEVGDSGCVDHIVKETDSMVMGHELFATQTEIQ